MTNVSRRIRLGIFDHLDEDGLDLSQQYNDRLVLAEACDRLGYHAYHLAEHHCTPHGRSPSPNVFLSSVAQRTKQLRIGPMVMLLSLQHPLRAYEEACMLDHLSGGRLELGIGWGSLPIELGYFGVSAESARELYSEGMEILTRAMRGGTLSYEGQHYRLHEVPLAITPYQRPHPPTWIPVSQPGSARAAAEIGANIASIGPASMVRKSTDAYRACNWRGGAPLVGLLRMIVADTSEAHAYSLAAAAYDRWLTSFRVLYDLSGVPAPPNLPPTFEAAIESELCVVGTAASVRSVLIDHLEQAGANYLLCQVAFGDLPLVAALNTATILRSELMAGGGP
ncbi:MULTISPECIES: LLM class flavin-dependent oxidoreductase [Bradyrhizobium]|uniref:LLM class flavin-dependent oxidoreductase n=4 Tax=Bradyrhizobium TaxID=374 RepID=A0AAE5X8Q5_9BRAD|nr:MULTISPECIES: LLM class flavin-dependent oxidoreductase [Bradyrhizobium]MCG2632924.1 LLM class flavin-dependent oxidoreductase [Bradyrhizobium zhengyangense]MCG2645530.1 LLM class flavin-dependent oxidoreductase [Bradyrhizobium zhengyangense]MCG2673127.1 LLM class flavin-dependent oxidoreductase [Bradyrhizobium zhengyangense]MDN4985655.1 LLM class flavin-dependent oxidoreductase [Bradyrhizobium sp. WYCCWR 13022]MDN5006115.1 LLM class flavin-dependent oxidoreductase [Bradyrhizobium sp. WYCCW